MTESTFICFRCRKAKELVDGQLVEDPKAIGSEEYPEGIIPVCSACMKPDDDIKDYVKGLREE